MELISGVVPEGPRQTGRRQTRMQGRNQWGWPGASCPQTYKNGKKGEKWEREKVEEERAKLFSIIRVSYFVQCSYINFACFHSVGTILDFKERHA